MKVRFIQDVTEPACGDHPAFDMARRGELGEATAVDAGKWRYSVKTARNPPFMCDGSEFEVIEAEEANP